MQQTITSPPHHLTTLFVAPRPSPAYTIHPPNHSHPRSLLSMSEPHSDRRAFLGGSAAALGYFFTADALSATRAADTPSETIRFAGIGVGGKGQSDILNAARVGQVVAMCDINEEKMNQTLHFKEKNRKSKEPPQPPLSESK